ESYRKDFSSIDTEKFTASYGDKEVFTTTIINADKQSAKRTKIPNKNFRPFYYKFVVLIYLG
ncbi:hypothetical protein, partial [Thomasclavelia cocleata]|uniref:hypothetical protein n=1 Tax=Thomasclavelia cocleata TaxID=69824 RepID=UPI00272B48A3